MRSSRSRFDSPVAPRRRYPFPRSPTGTRRRATSSSTSASRGSGPTGLTSRRMRALTPAREPLLSRTTALRWEYRCRPSSSDRKSTRLNSCHMSISYAVFCLKKKKSQGRVLPEHHSREPSLRRLLRESALRPAPPYLHPCVCDGWHPPVHERCHDHHLPCTVY